MTDKYLYGIIMIVALLMWVMALMGGWDIAKAMCRRWRAKQKIGED